MADQTTSTVKAMIFGAGLGTRFKPWTDTHPKALAIINGKSLLQRNIEYLQQYGIYNVVVNVHHFASQIIDAIETNKGWGSKVQISDEQQMVLETGGGLLHAYPLLKECKTIVALNVDILTNLNLDKALTYHYTKGPMATLLVSDRNSSRCFLFDKKNQLCGWRNKNTGETKMAKNETIFFEKSFSGISIIDSSFFEKCAIIGKFSLVDAYLSLAGNNSIVAFDHSGDKWVDVGSNESVPIAEALFT